MQGIEWFIKEHGLEENVAFLLRKEEPTVQNLFMARGSLQHVPADRRSAVAMGRIRDAQYCVANRIICPTEDEVSLFIWENQLDEKASKMMRDVGPPIQKEVMDSGPLPIAAGKNPSASCVKRIQDAKEKIRDQMKYGIKPGTPLPVAAEPGVLFGGSGSTVSKRQRTEHGWAVPSIPGVVPGVVPGVIPGPVWPDHFW